MSDLSIIHYLPRAVVTIDVLLYAIDNRGRGGVVVPLPDTPLVVLAALDVLFQS